MYTTKAIRLWLILTTIFENFGFEGCCSKPLAEKLIIERRGRFLKPMLIIFYCYYFKKNKQTKHYFSFCFSDWKDAFSGLLLKTIDMTEQLRATKTLPHDG